MTELNELVVVEKANVPALFAKDGCDPLLKRIKEEVGKFEADISTAKGRKEVASMASKVAKSKVYLEGLGKDLVTGIKEQAKVIDAERKKVRDELDLLKEEVRKPLTDWENAEKERVAKHEQNIQTINDYLNVEPENSGQAKDLLEAMKDIDTGECFEEFELAATKAKAAALTQLEAKFIVLRDAEKEKAEADRLEKERLEKEREERETKIAKEAEERAEREKKEAAELAEKEKEAAIEEERKRVAAVKESERIAEEKRQDNKRHRGKINREAKACLMKEGWLEPAAEQLITLIAKGKIANITINY
jgi:hypothetical protein